jgi:polyphosphate kinase 2 (PPK2 family)
VLEKVNLDKDLSHHKYKLVLRDLQQRLYELEKTCWDRKIASVVVFEGWDAAGKGTAIATVTARLDPRGFRLHPIQPPRPHEMNRPWLYRFWQRIPNYGEMAIFDRSWYGRVLADRVEGLVPKAEWRAAFRDILEFERMLADDGVAIVKFWLHIGKREQKRRFRELEADPLRNWHVTPEDWARHRKYDDYLLAVEEMLELSDSDYAPWTVIEATSRWYARKKIFDVLIHALEARLGDLAPPHAPPDAQDEQEDELRAAIDRGEGK